jgi:2-hydroxy-6-oxonona-2,4-dienedioate hydrolase
MAPFLCGNGFRVYCLDRPSFGLADTREVYWPKSGSLSVVEFINDFADALCLDCSTSAATPRAAQPAAYYIVAHPERIHQLRAHRHRKL